MAGALVLVIVVGVFALVAAAGVMVVVVVREGATVAGATGPSGGGHADTNE